MLGAEVLEKYGKFLLDFPKHSDSLILELPFVKYKVYEKWKPDPVNVLLMAESPSS